MIIDNNIDLQHTTYHTLESDVRPFLYYNIQTEGKYQEKCKHEIHPDSELTQ